MDHVANGAYTGVAPDPKIINLRVLNSHGFGAVSNVLKGLNWILAPVDPNKPVGEKNRRKPEQLLDPPTRNFLDDGRAGTHGIHPGILVPRRREPVRRQGGRHHPANHPCVEAATDGGVKAARYVCDQLLDDVLRREPAIGQRLAEPAPELVRRRGGVDRALVERRQVLEGGVERRLQSGACVRAHQGPAGSEVRVCADPSVSHNESPRIHASVDAVAVEGGFFGGLAAHGVPQAKRQLKTLHLTIVREVQAMLHGWRSSGLR